MLRPIGILLVFIISTGCVDTRFMLTGRTYSPWEGPVQILQELPKDVVYKEVGWITGKITEDYLDWGDILLELQKEAKKRGANAIVLVDKETITGYKTSANMFTMSSESKKEKSMTVIAIRIF